MDIYERLVEIIKKEDDLEEFLTHESKYDYLYHLSRIRWNVLEWYCFDSNARLLEIGAECGALTGLFCERVKEVVAIDKDEKKCKVNEERNQKYNNKLILTHNKKNIRQFFDNSFDYVTILGNVFQEDIKTANKALKMHGNLIIAVDNKYGIKYWAGANDEHTGIRFDSISGYKGVDNIYSYTKEELFKIMNEEGFIKKAVYYPIPDYRFSMEIYSENNLPKNGDFSENTPSFQQDRLLLFEEAEVLNSLCRDGKYDLFANSFLVFAEKVNER